MHLHILSDIKSGIIKNYVTRTAKFNYLAAKYIAVFVTGGVAVVMPLLINYLTAITILPSLVWPVGVFASSPKSIWSAIFYTHPHTVLVCAILKSFVGAMPLSHFLSDIRSIAFANSVIIYGARIATNLLLTILDTIHIHTFI